MYILSALNKLIQLAYKSFWVPYALGEEGGGVPYPRCECRYKIYHWDTSIKQIPTLHTVIYHVRLYMY